MKNYFLIHGSFGSPYVNWLPYLQKEIEQRKTTGKEEPIVYVPQMPTGVGLQNYKNWERLLLTYHKLGLITEETIIFAHSIAPVFVCKFLIKNKIKIHRLVSVCGFNNFLGINADYDEVNKSMYLDNLEEVKKYAKEIVCLYSDNDPYVNFNVEKNFAETIATKQIVIKNGGHLNASSGYAEFKELLKYL